MLANLRKICADYKTLRHWQDVKDCRCRGSTNCHRVVVYVYQKEIAIYEEAIRKMKSWEDIIVGNTSNREPSSRSMDDETPKA